MKNDRIKLVSETTTQDADGFAIKSRYEAEFWADVQSVKRQEFYMAESAKTKVSNVIVMSAEEYKLFKKNHGKPILVVYDGEEFKIIRPYDNKKTKDIELTVVGVE